MSSGRPADRTGSQRSSGSADRDTKTPQGSSAGSRQERGGSGMDRTTSDRRMSTGERPNGESSLQPGQMLGDVRQQASARVSDQKQRAASGMESVAQAVSQLGDQLRQQNPSIASFADTTASQLRHFSTQLEQRDIGELVDEVERLARRNPAVFIGGAFALGLLGARFLKSNSSDANAAGGYASGDYTSTRGNYDSTASSSYRSSGAQAGRNRPMVTDTTRANFDSETTSLEG